MNKLGRRRGVAWLLVFMLIAAGLGPSVAAEPPRLQEDDSKIDRFQEDDADDEDAPDETEDDDAIEVYEGPNFGFTVTYDSDVWELNSESDANGEDFVTFLSGPSFLTLNATAGYSGDPASCRDDWTRTLRRVDGVTDFRPMLDADGEALVGDAAEAAFGVYTYQSEDGAEVFDLECRVLIPGEANLVIILETFAETYDAELGAVGEFLEGVDTSAVSLPDPDDVSPPGGGVDDREAIEAADAGVDLILLVDTFERLERSLLSTTTPDPNLVRYAYEDGEFVIETLTEDAGAWQAGLPNTYREVSIAVDATFASETGGRYVKLACRSTLTAGGLSEYGLVLDPSDGYVAFDSWENGERTVFFEEILPEVVNLDQATNRIELACFGNQIVAKINGTVVASVEDDTHEEGLVYRAAGTYTDAEGTVEVHFDNLHVQIPASERPEELG